MIPKTNRLSIFRHFVLLFFLIMTVSLVSSCGSSDLLQKIDTISSFQPEKPSETVSAADAEIFSDTDEDSAGDLYYYYNLLNAEQKQLYMTILKGYHNLDTDIRLNTDKFQLITLIEMVLSDHPELFWIDASYKYSVYPSYVIFHPEYTCDTAKKEQRTEEINRAAAGILNTLSQETSDYSKIRLVFEYLIDTVSYNPDAEDNQNIYSSLVMKESVCAGYAKATQYLLQKAEIPCIYATGTITDGGSHAWNIVRCDGNYYQVDTTFGASSYTNPETEIQQIEIPHELTYNYAYLCCSDETLYRDRTVSEYEIPLPECSLENYNYYIMNGICFNTCSSEVTDAIAKSISSGETYWQCQFSSYEAFEEMTIQLQEGLYGNLLLEHFRSGSFHTYYSCDPKTLTVKMWY